MLPRAESTGTGGLGDHRSRRTGRPTRGSRRAGCHPITVCGSQRPRWLVQRTSHEVIIETIGAVTTTTGLTVRADNATATTFEWRLTASDLDDLPHLHRRPRTSADHGGRPTSTNKRRPFAAGAG